MPSIAQLTGPPPTLTIDRRHGSPISRVLQPSAMVSFSLPAAREHFLSRIGGPLGTARTTYAWALMHLPTREAFLQAARQVYAEEMLPFANRGARVLAGFGGTPIWLAPEPIDRTPMPGSGWPRFATLPPTDPAAYAQLAAEVAAIGDDRTWLEFWNEPHSTTNWQGSVAELFDLASLVAKAVHGAGRKIAGLAHASWNDPREADPDTRSLLQRWIESGGPADFDGLSWHCFSGTDPSTGLEGAGKVRGWLAARGLPDLPQFLTEWQRWSAYPAWLDPSRDTMVGAAHHAHALHAMSREPGIAGATVAILEGFERPVTLGMGTFGLLCSTPAGLVEKPTFEVQRLLGELGSTQFPARVPPRIARTGVDVIAGDQGALLYRYDTLNSVPVRFNFEHAKHRLESVVLEPFDVKMLEP